MKLEKSRNFAFDNINWDYWKRLINHTFDLNCDFIYLLNSPRPLTIENPDFPKQLEKLDLLLTELRKIGVNKLRVASAQLMSYIAKHYSDFNVLASTSLEYKTIWEYQNFIAFHPEVKQIVPSHDVNKNFLLLKNLRKRYPNIELELMVNEGCLQGCPNRSFHEMINMDRKISVNSSEIFSGIYGTKFCLNVVKKYPILSFVIGNHIFPWDIKEYAKIGITNFKLVGRDRYEYFDTCLYGFEKYLQGIDDIKNIEKYSMVDYIHHLYNNDILQELTTTEYKKYLPNIRHFVKSGHLCMSRCAAQCRYCYKCAEKIHKIYIKKQVKTIQYVSPCKI